MTTDLSQRKCSPCEGGAQPLSSGEVQNFLSKLSGWTLEQDEIVKTFTFKNYYETVAFVNAVAWVSHREDHHPEMEFGYKKCKVRYATHAVKGLSENDFICAAKVDELLSR
jgi:4a-hydroxytetrahydrobiopterin dehydratase